MLENSLGALQKVGHRDVFVTGTDREGTPVFGPYERRAPGRYVAEFNISADWYDDSYSDTICGWVDVSIELGHVILAQSYLYASRLNAGRTRVHLPFELAYETEVELRVHTTGRTSLHIDLERTMHPIEQGRDVYSPMLGQSEQPKDQFFLDHLPNFRNIYEGGDDVVVTEKGPIVSSGGISFYVRNIEDFQLVHEIFHSNEYTMRSSKPKFVIDIGMNVGLASLLMASDPTVLEVHSFEPFAAPYNRAIENIALNPALAAKISTYQLGLSDKDEEMEVLVDESATISTSIRGIAAGRSEKIIIKDASVMVQQVLDRASGLGADVFVKIDCEGSEFAIFESLARHDQFGSIRGVLVEWHRWWSSKKTQKHLLAPLLANDFVIFDRTNPSDRWAGQFSAVRVSR